VADRTSGDRTGQHSPDGASEGQHDGVSASGLVRDARGLADRDQTLTDADETLSDSDQTSSDSDQTSSDSDQTSSDSDQTSADRDQVAADRDQAASDRDLAAGADPTEHERSRHIREGTTHQREQTADSRLQAAKARDAAAHARDLDALARDRAAEARSLAMRQLDGDHEAAPGTRALTAADIVVRAVSMRKRAAQHRTQAAAQRELAAQDRQAAAADRAQAAQERAQALADGEAYVAELQRERELRQQALRHQHRAEKLARTLQLSLSPPRLPTIPGLDVAVHYEPFAPEEVGGDFYDLFPLPGGRTGFFLGDVCGKGPDAASVTSLARYTMRTAAMLKESPEAILMDLNAALLMETAGSMQTCTTIYGELDISPGIAAVTVAVAGHPPPWIVRENGTVEPAPAHGTMLGAVRDPSFHTCQLNLQPGDALVLCSDGIHDTKLDGIPVDEQRVAQLLSGVRHASAQALVDRLKQVLQAIDRPLRDDFAIMALRRTPQG
jgi:sigma-B regulation protein RsbU (phosphoserine phosphatase)